MNGKAPVSTSLDACAALNYRFDLLRLRGKAIDTRLSELRSRYDELLCHEVNVLQEKEQGDIEGEFGIQAFGAAHQPVSLSPCSFVRATTPTRLFCVDGSGSSPQGSPFQDPSSKVPNGTGPPLGASTESGSCSSPIIVVEVTDSEEATSKTPTEAPLSTVVQELDAPGTEKAVYQSIPFTEPTMSSRENEDHEREAHTPFLFGQVYRISSSAPLTSSASDIFRTTSEGPGTSAGKQEVLPVSSSNYFQAADTAKMGATITRERNEQQTKPTQTSSVELFLKDRYPVALDAVSGVASTRTAPFLQDSSPEQGTATTAVVPPSFTRCSPDAAGGPSRVVSSSALDFEEMAREALRKGEWKEAKDGKNRVYYYNTKERRSCWNLAKEFRRLEKTSSVGKPLL